MVSDKMLFSPADSHSPDLNNNNDDIAMVYCAVSCRDDDYFLASVAVMMQSVITRAVNESS